MQVRLVYADAFDFPDPHVVTGQSLDEAEMKTLEAGATAALKAVTLLTAKKNFAIMFPVERKCTDPTRKHRVFSEVLLCSSLVSAGLRHAIQLSHFLLSEGHAISENPRPDTIDVQVPLNHAIWTAKCPPLLASYQASYVTARQRFKKAQPRRKKRRLAEAAPL